MKAPVSWIREYAALPADLDTTMLTARLTLLGLKLEVLHRAGDQISGPLVVGRVLTMEPEPQKNGKTINWCTVDVGAANGTGEPQGIVCGAHNFAPGDLVVVVLPGGVLPGGFEISARKTYGHVSAGMICSSRELGTGDDADGIIVLPVDAGSPVTTRSRCSASTRRSSSSRSTRTVPTHSRCGGWPGRPRSGSTYRSRTRPTGPSPSPTSSRYPVEVAPDTRCDVFSGRSVSGFDPSAPTPAWMAQRIQQCGMRPISLAVDVTNYVMLELGQPIHGFDRDTLAGPIRVRLAQEGERLRTLDGADRTLTAEDVLITDDSGPIGLAGVMGGETTELSDTTTNIFIEAAHWDPVRIFRTSKRHKLPSEAAKRFERGTDPTVTLRAADRVAELLVRYGGGTVEPGVTHVGEAPPQPTITIDDDLPARITGLEIASETVEATLVAIGCTVVRDGSRLTATRPPWRPDLIDPFDLVEEVARVVGYDRIPSVLPTAPAGRGLTRAQRLRRRVGRVLAGAGYVEVIDFPFVGEADFDRLGLAGDDERRRALRLANPLSAEEPAMTTTLLPGILKAAARNAGHGTTSLALFEVASVTIPRASGPAPIYGVDRRPTEGEYDDLLKALPDQPLHLAVTLSGDREAAGWWGEGRAVTWADAIDAVRVVAEALDVELTVRAATRRPWHPGRCAELSVDGHVLGYAGELHPKVCESFGVPARTSAAEIDLDALLERATDTVAAPTYSSFPVAKEDVALVVDVDVAAADVEAALREGAGELLESVRLFDVYTGPQVGEGKKSLAFALRFRAPDRTLTEQEAGAARDAAVALAAERYGAVQR